MPALLDEDSGIADAGGRCVSMSNMPRTDNNSARWSARPAAELSRKSASRFDVQATTRSKKKSLTLLND